MPVWGFQTDVFPAFYTRSSGLKLEHSFQSTDALARALAAHALTSPRCGSVIANPIPAEFALDEAEEHTLIENAMQAAHKEGISGKETTPFVLGHLHRASEGRTVEANLALVENNTQLAARIAVAMASFA